MAWLPGPANGPQSTWRIGFASTKLLSLSALTSWVAVVREQSAAAARAAPAVGPGGAAVGGAMVTRRAAAATTAEAQRLPGTRDPPIDIRPSSRRTSQGQAGDLDERSGL